MKFYTLILLLYLSTTVTAQGMPRLVPEAYWGTALIDGEPAPEGSQITVEIYETSEIVGRAEVIDDTGLYSIDIIFDNDLTEPDEGAEEGQALLWRINGIPCSIPGSDLANSGTVNMNLTLSASTNTGADTASDTSGEGVNSYLIFIIALIVLIIVGFIYMTTRH